MWKPFLAFLTHRCLLFIVALLAINSQISQPVEGKFFKPIKPVSMLFADFSTRVTHTPDVQRVIDLRNKDFLQVFQSTQNPLIWIAHFLDRFVHLSLAVNWNPALLLILTGNVFFFIYLWELRVLVGRLSILEVGNEAAILMVLWITSYEFTLGSPLVIPCFLLTCAIRHAIDDRWFVVGLAVAALAFIEPVAVFIMPILLLYFWQYQRHLPGNKILQNFLFFLAPVGAVIAFRWNLFQALPGFVKGSALFNVLALFKDPSQWSWALSKASFGQTIALAIFIFGAVSSFILNTSFSFRIIPGVTLLLVLVSSSYGELASRLMLAGTCLGGMSSISSIFLLRFIQIAMVTLGMTEVWILFS